MLVLVDQITPRIQFTFDFIFKQRNIAYELTTSLHDFEAYNDFKRLNYSSHSVENVKHISPCLLLRQSSIIPVQWEKARMIEMDCLSFDQTPDIVASVFFVLTRFEEYLCKETDEFGRFPFDKSCLKEYEWVEMAMCDRWSKAIIEFIYPDLYIDTALALSLNMQGFQLIPTFDIDNTFAYKCKGGQRKFLSVCKDVLSFNFKRISERKRVNNGSKDPYDTFDQISEIAQNHDGTRMFWLVESNGDKDRNLDIHIPEHQALIRQMSINTEIGLHPSFDSFQNSSKLNKEKSILENILDKKVNATRQHFLRFRLPISFRLLIEAGIEHEYSMGFAEHVGFRCGTARSHSWFDVSANEVTSLQIHPLVYMDGTLNEYMHLQPEESKNKISQLREEVRTYGGDFVFIWHNETIGEYGKWKGWSTVLQHTLTLS